MDDIRNKIVETEDLIGTLGQYSAEIGLITDTITNLAQQTNLLTLNAAIEAARAGKSKLLMSKTAALFVNKCLKIKVSITKSVVCNEF